MPIRRTGITFALKIKTIPSPVQCYILAPDGVARSRRTAYSWTYIMCPSSLRISCLLPSLLSVMSSSFTTPSPSHRASLQTAFEDGKEEAFDPSPDIVMASAIDKTLEKDVEVASSQRDYTFVTFEKGTGEDPREWSSARKW